MASRIGSRLELLRAYLLPSSVADSLAGYAVAAGVASLEWEAGAVAAAAGASIALYGFGLVTNDLCDLRKDRERAPRRPLPSGRVRPVEAAGLAALAAGAGILLGWAAGALLTALAVLLLAFLYNAGGKRVAVAGNLLMGGCRGGNFLLGAAAAAGEPQVFRSPAVLAAALAPALFIALVTAVSILEDHPFRRRRLHAIATPILGIPLALAALQPLAAGGWLNAILLLWILISAQRLAAAGRGPDHPAALYVRRALGGIYLVDAGAVWAFAPPSAPALAAIAALYALAAVGWAARWLWISRGGADT
ncbi:MAG: UbiA family prenyltransferase [Planctomycetes bacterium]|nr:UbiA family prenyltransferase [Planctomycetota bacterium]